MPTNQTTTYVLDDGSTILILSSLIHENDTVPTAEAETLSLGAEFSTWIVDVVAAGISFEVLKAIGQELVRLARLDDSAPDLASTSIATAVERHLDSVGHANPVIEDVVEMADQGWLLSGHCQTGEVTVRADSTGRILHLRVR